MGDVPIPLGTNAWKRDYAGAPEIKLLNRFFEKNPANLQTGAALLARPGSTPLTSVGDQPHRGKFTQPGFMGGDLFVAVGSTLYRLDADGEALAITGELLNDGIVSFATARGPGYEHLFIADGLLLQVYTGGNHASGTLTASGAITNQVIKIGSTYYSWGNAAAMDDAADGSSTKPWLALLGNTDDESLVNMEKLINFAGIRGTTYSASLGGPSADVTAEASTGKLVVTSKDTSTDANSIATTVESGSDLAWGDTTLTGGGTHALNGVEIPGGNGCIAVASLAGYVLAAQTDSDRFYWIKPGELTIGALDFATAEQQPDKIVDLVSTGDVVWLLGESSSEVWYPTGDSTAPFAPVQGRTWDQGVVEGTAVRIGQNRVAVVGAAEKKVYLLGGGQPEPISHHGIDERIRKQLQRELDE